MFSWGLVLACQKIVDGRKKNCCVLLAACLLSPQVIEFSFVSRPELLLSAFGLFSFYFLNRRSYPLKKDLIFGEFFAAWQL